MKKTKILFICCFVSLTLLLGLNSCSSLTSIAKQVAGVANLVNCEYSLKDVNNVYVAGVNIKNISNGNLSVTDIAKLSSAIIAKKVPISMDVNVNVKNPTANSAALTAMNWICEIDGTQFANGNTTSTYTINPNSTSTIPLSVSSDIYQMFSSGGVESLKNFVNSFSSDGTSSKIALKIKPTLNVAGVQIAAPEYITLQKNTGTTTTQTTTNNSNNNSNNNNNGKSGTGLIQSGKITGK